jgi:hypothetical protein
VEKGRVVAVKPFINKLVCLLADTGNYGDLIAWPYVLVLYR